MIRVGTSPGRGRGVFAIRLIRRGETIERAPVIVVPAEQVELIEQTALQHYFFRWGKESDQGAVALGCGSLYNHTYEPNARFHYKLESFTIKFTALREIQPEEEITINCNGEPADTTPLWFTPGTG